MAYGSCQHDVTEVLDGRRQQVLHEARSSALATVAGLVGALEGFGAGEPFVRRIGDHTVVDIPQRYTKERVAGLFILTPKPMKISTHNSGSSRPAGETMTTKPKPDKRILATVAVVHTVAVTLTWRDLRHRTVAEVGVDKRIWRAASALNTLGAAAYWLLGRRGTPPH